MSESKETNGQMTVDDDVIDGFATRPATITASACARSCAPISRRNATGPTALTPGRASTMSALKVADLETATRFYENVFGFRQVKTGRSRGHTLASPDRRLCRSRADAVNDSEDDPEAKLVGPGPAIHHFGVAVADRRSVLDLIRANGGEILSDPNSGTVKFRSPDGTIAEIADPDRYEKMKGCGRLIPAVRPEAQCAAGFAVPS